MICLNAVFLFEGMQVATDPSYVTAFGVAGSSALVMVLLDIQHYGTLAAQVFFGLWLAPLGYLAYRSGLFPKGLGVVLVLASVSYLADSLAAFLLPHLELQIKPFLIIAPLGRRDLDGRVFAREGCEVRTPGRTRARGRPSARQALKSCCAVSGRALASGPRLALVSQGRQRHVRRSAGQTNASKELPRLL